MPMKRIYLDNAATTPVDPEVQKEIMRVISQNYGNASSIHEFGITARNMIEKSRDIIADFVNISPSGVIFTSSGTESVNIALQGIMKRHKKANPHLITSNIEHPAIFNTANYLKQEGFDVTILPVNRNGFVEIDDIKNAIQKNTKLISIHYVNNVLGTIQNIRKIGELLQNTKIIFHTDAVQAFGKIPIDMKKEKIDLLSLSGHKLYCCKGIGALCVNAKKFLIPDNN